MYLFESAIIKALKASVAALLVVAGCLFTGLVSAEEYRVDVGDEIRITVYDEPDLSFNALKIDSLGAISLPFVGELIVKQRTAPEIEALLVSRLKPDYLVNPKVTVAVVSFRQFFINGEVVSPGGIAFQPGLNLHKAITLAGGFSERASRSNIYVIQEGDTGKGKKVGLSYKVQPGDIITVEQSFF